MFVCVCMRIYLYVYIYLGIVRPNLIPMCTYVGDAYECNTITHRVDILPGTDSKLEPQFTLKDLPVHSQVLNSSPPIQLVAYPYKEVVDYQITSRIYT